MWEKYASDLMHDYLRLLLLEIVREDANTRIRLDKVAELNSVVLCYFKDEPELKNLINDFRQLLFKKQELEKSIKEVEKSIHEVWIIFLEECRRYEMEAKEKAKD